MKSLPFRLLLLAGLLAASAPLPAQDAPAKEVVMNDDLMQRLVAFALDQKETGSVTGKVTQAFGLSDGRDLPVKLLETERPAGTFFAIPVTDGSKDILVLKKFPDGHLEAYLTDRSRKLRAAAIADGSPAARLILNEPAEPGFQAVLNHLAREAAEDLPPAAK